MNFHRLDGKIHQSPPEAVPSAMTELRHEVRAAGIDALVDLSRSEPLPIPLSDECAERVAAEFGRARQYSPPGGLISVREAAARYASARRGLAVDAAGVTITAGAMAGLAVALRALIEPGDEVLVPVPYFHSYPKQVAMLGGVPRLVDTRSLQGELTPEAVERALSPRTRALLLCNPGNPSGVLLDRERLAAILAALPANVAVIADEVYAEYLYDADSFSALAMAAAEDAGREVVALDTASKTAAMPGWRVGTAIASSSELAARLAAAAATLSGAPNTLAQVAFGAWLGDPPELDRMAPYRPRLRDVLDVLTASGLTSRPPDGSYYVWVTAPGDNVFGSTHTALQLARSSGVLVWPGILFGDPESVRVSLSVPRRELRDGVIRFTDSWREVRESDISISRSGR
ncbi:MAG TPA: pyridoxal phosphate-dependent aminotransferase [Thermoleophilaceae bacterium]|nr:pyridoxal phosphate-dependent aminotransferase [Thermoleophilaceae bacterium]